MEQIYTIPVNEAFDEVRDKVECGCPFCVLHRKLQNDELDIILGASMMEPDIRIKTNESGFCLTHYNMMLRRRRMLGMGLMLESHLDAVKKKIEGKSLFGGKLQNSLKDIGQLNADCYVCGRIDKNLGAMIATAVYLYETDLDFRERFSHAPYFCLPHYERMMSYAARKMPKRVLGDFFEVAEGIEEKYVTELRGDVSWFCKKFDYRYDEEPWYNSKDSVQRSIKFLSGELGQDD
jgi:hypothetical protein